MWVCLINLFVRFFRLLLQPIGAAFFYSILPYLCLGLLLNLPSVICLNLGFYL